MSVLHLLASRYVWPRTLSVISIIGGISVVGMVIGTAALIIVMSLFNGFRDLAYSLMIGFGPHVQVVASEGRDLPNPEMALKAVHQAGLASADLVTSGRLVLMSGAATSVVDAVGISDDSSVTVQGPRQATFVGSFTTRPEMGVASITLASGVAERMGLYLGDTVRLVSPQTIERAIRVMALPTGIPAVVRGIFQSNAAREIDDSRIYVSANVISDAIRTSQGSSGATSVDAVLPSPLQALEQAEDLAATIQADLGPRYRVRTWADVNRGLVETMKLERWGSFIVLSLIVVVAAFNVLVALTLGVVQKRRDIAVLLTLGMRPNDIRAMYIRQGLTLGAVAVACGVCLGVGVTWGQITFSWITFDVSQGYLVPALPMKIQVGDVVATAGVGLLLAATAAIYPARKASQTQIAKALQSE